MPNLIVFDFDGVIAESEVLANTVLAEMVTELGHPTSVEDSYRLYMGKRSADVMAAIERAVGGTLPTDFAARYQDRTFLRFREALRPVEGALDFIAAFADVPRCIASSSSPDRLALCLDILDLVPTFGANVFSASSVARGKPSPDIFLHAALRMGATPAHCIVIEDSPAGVAAGVAAGMTVVGLLAAGHIQPDHAERLAAAGAHHVARNYFEAEVVTRAFLSA